MAAVAGQPEWYRPAACAHCRCTAMWRHGRYYRKADRRVAHEPPGEAGALGGSSSSSSRAGSLNPVPVLRFICRSCTRTCSRLPACIAPRRWYDWCVQQAVLVLLLGGVSLRGCAHCSGRDRRTVRRWRDWLARRGEQFAFCLRSRFPELGRCTDQGSFWRHVIDTMGLRQAMVWLDLELDLP
jgi:hypothetical protein